MVELYIADKKIDKTEEVNFSINKSWQNQTDPTTIQSDYSKTLSIPITKNNIEVFGQWQMVDRADVSNGTENTGLYFDPNSQIPFSLEINGDIYVTGYVKFTKCNYSSSDKNFEITLNGRTTNFFQVLKGVENGRFSSWFHFPVTLDATFVKKCWDWTYENRGVENPEDILGFSICNNGKLADFNNNKYQATSLFSQENISLEESKLNFIKDIPEGEMYEGWNKEYRSYYQRPYLRIPFIFDFIKRFVKLEGYNLTLDDKFFSETNPWFHKGAVLLNQLDVSSKAVYSESTGTGKNIGIHSSENPVRLNEFTWYDGTETQHSGNNIIAISTFQHPCINRFNLNLGKYEVTKIEGGKYTGNSVKVYYRFGDASSSIIETQTLTVNVTDGKTDEIIIEDYFPDTGILYIRCESGLSFSITTYNRDKKQTLTITATENVRSGRPFRLTDVLGDFTVYDFFLQYCKMFNLSVICDKNDVKVLTRESLFNDSNIYDLQIDRNSFTVEPYKLENKYVTFDFKDSDTTYSKNFKSENGFNYGGKKLVTNYNFNTTNQTLTNSFNSVINENQLNVYLTNSMITDNKNKFVLKYADYALPTFTVRSAVPFTTNKKSYSIGFECKVTDNNPVKYISDDTGFERRSDTYCWHKWAFEPDIILDKTKPCYISSYITYDHQNYSYLFTEPSVNYLKNPNISKETVNGLINCKYIYPTFWESYIEDRYFTNGKKLTTKVLFKPDEIVNLSFGRLYDIDNCVWHINAINDYNPNSFEPVTVEFVKVNDINNYKINKTYGDTEIPFGRYINADDYGMPSNINFIDVKVASSEVLTKDDFYLSGGNGRIMSMYSKDGYYYVRVWVNRTYGVNNVVWLNCSKKIWGSGPLISQITKMGAEYTCYFEKYNLDVVGGARAGSILKYYTNNNDAVTFEYDRNKISLSKVTSTDTRYPFGIRVISNSRVAFTTTVDVLVSGVKKYTISVNVIAQNRTIVVPSRIVNA